MSKTPLSLLPKGDRTWEYQHHHYERLRNTTVASPHSVCLNSPVTNAPHPFSLVSLYLAPHTTSGEGMGQQPARLEPSPRPQTLHTDFSSQGDFSWAEKSTLLFFKQSPTTFHQWHSSKHHQQPHERQ
jgi:hypothetical protein